MKAALLYPDNTPEGKFRIEDIPKPEIGAGEVLIKVDFCGICGTDLHMPYDALRMVQRTQHPLIGHEFSGVITNVGDGVKKLKVGDKVVGEAVVPCLSCKACKEGKLNICYELKSIGFHLPGSFAEYVKLPAFKVLKIPEGVSQEHAALTEPLSVALHGVNRSRVKSGDSVVIFGDGPIGLGMAQMVRRIASKVILVGAVHQRLKVAEELKVDSAINATEPNYQTKLRSAVGVIGADIILEVSGNPTVPQLALEICARGGRIVQTGLSMSSSTVPWMHIMSKELEIVGANGYLNEFSTVLDMMSKKMITPEILISTIRPLEEINEAMAAARAYQVNKVLLKP